MSIRILKHKMDILTVIEISESLDFMVFAGGVLLLQLLPLYIIGLQTALNAFPHT